VCGIAGILRTGDAALPDPGALRRMVAAIGYRGPDETSEFLAPDLQLAVARLAIVDREHGGQPVHGCGGELTAVFNGEIYNHGDLRAELRARGHAIEGRCDTAVLPHLYEQHGPELVGRLSGMFAFALWDAPRRRLLLARDRLGIKPLYLARTRDYLLFGSEIKALLASGLLPREIDRDALDDLFSLSYPCPPRTMFRGVEELRPAHLLVAGAGRPAGAPRRYWRAPFVPRGEHRTVRAADAEHELRELLLRSVETHAQADTRVATFLSGGLDSSALAAAYREVTGEAPTTFSIGFTSPEHDEREYAARVAAALGAPSHVVTCGPSAALHYPDVIWHTELPLQYPLALPLTLLAAAARKEGHRVVLTGEGADELLGGYDCFRADKMRRLLDRPGLRLLRPPFYRQLYRWLGTPDGLVDHFLRAQQRSAADVESAFGGVYPPWYDVWLALGLERERLLSVGGRRPRPIEHAPEGFHHLVPEQVRALHPLDAGMALELESRLPSWILLIGDRAAMANGVEARVPLLDHELVEWMVRLHPSHKLRGFTEKAVLRGAMRGLLPESIRLRRKRPFYTPIKSWFFAERRPEYVDELLSERALSDAGLFAPAVVASLRQGLERAPDHHLVRMQLEWLLILVLGAQLLHRMFVADFAGVLAGPPRLAGGAR
jgi:asparagine synthase (glutamine-hydrolysing)